VLPRRNFKAGALALAASSIAGKPQAAEPARVDCHTHVFVRGLPHAANARYVPDYDASYEELLAITEANGIGRIVIEQPSFLGFDNSYLFCALRAKPERFRGVPWIAPRTSAAEWDEIARLGVRGLRFPIFGLPTPNWADYKETFAEVKRRDWTLDLYVECRRLPEILPMLLESGAKVIVPHFGMFDPRLGPMRDPGFKVLLEAAKTGRVYVKLCGAYRVGLEGAREAAPLLLAAFGTSHLVWASDWPHTNTDLSRTTTYPKTLQWLADWVPDEATSRKNLVDTPRRLYGFS
jgi:predicted TIM-barrel fold metal-dependent hydrolase